MLGKIAMLSRHLERMLQSLQAVEMASLTWLYIRTSMSGS